MLYKNLTSFSYACKGIKIAWKEEVNFRIQVVIGLSVLCFAYALNVTHEEFLILILTIGVVLAVETLNTALEEFCDMVRGSHDPHVAKIKDLGAGASLIASISSALIGIKTFLPHIISLL